MRLQDESRKYSDGRKVRYAVVGAGWISQEDFIPGVEHTGNSVMTALVTGDQTKAKALAKQYGIRQVYDYDRYGQMLESGGAETKYFSQCILYDRNPVPDGEEGLADIRVLRAIEEALEAGMPKPVILRSERRSRPCREQIIRLPAVKSEDLIKAAAPGGS